MMIYNEEFFHAEKKQIHDGNETFYIGFLVQLTSRIRYKHYPIWQEVHMISKENGNTSYSKQEVIASHLQLMMLIQSNDRCHVFNYHEGNIITILPMSVSNGPVTL